MPLARRSDIRLVLLRTVARLPCANGRPVDPSNIRRVLLIRPDHLGDVLFATPALRLLRQSLPQAHITVLCGPWSAAALQGNANVDAVETCPFPGFTRQPKPSILQPYQLLVAEALRLRRRRFDVAIVLRFDHWWGALLACAAGVPHRIGYDLATTRPLLTEALPYIPRRHEVEQNIGLVERVGEGLTAGPFRAPLEFFTSPADEAAASRWLAEHGIGVEQGLVALHPGAGVPVKRWTPQAFGAVARTIAAARPEAVFVLTGTSSERDLVLAVQGNIAGRTLIAAGLSLGLLGALYRRCRLVVGVDSGALHLAVAVGTPTVHLYGPVDTATFGPWGATDRHRVVATDFACAPCNRLDWRAAELPAHGCIAGVLPQRVAEAALDLLEVTVRDRLEYQASSALQPP